MSRPDISKEPVVVMSLDSDWADDKIVDWSVGLFEKRRLPVTVFATQSLPCLKRGRTGCEVGLHPRLLGCPDHRKVVEELRSEYPQAKGVRAHGLFEYADLMITYRNCGLAWDSSQQLYLCSHIQPYRHPSGIRRLPIFWEDDDYFTENPAWDIKELRLDTPGVKCFDFHPVHLRLNTASPAQYQQAKAEGLTSDALDHHAQTAEQGVFALFEQVCALIKKEGFPVYTIGEVCSWV